MALRISQLDRFVNDLCVSDTPATIERLARLTAASLIRHNPVRRGECKFPLLGVVGFL